MSGHLPITGTTSPVASLKGMQPMHDAPNVLSSSGEVFNAGSTPALWQSKHLAGEGHVSGYTAKNRGTIASFDEKAPIEAPSSDRGARFLVGD